MSCFEFLEDEKPYLEKTLKVANQYRKEPINSELEILKHHYYAALIFEINQEYEKAIECISSIWNTSNFLPLAYLYFHLLYTIEKIKEEEERKNRTITRG